MRTTVRAGLAVVAVAALAAAGFGVAVAATSQPTTYKACSTSSGALRLLESGKCAKGSHKVSVSAQGPRGPRGATGPAGPFPKTLPSGKTETGAFVLTSAPGAAFLGSISFTFPLAADIPGSRAPSVRSTSASSDPTDCTGNYETPRAAPGYLCLYLAHDDNTLFVEAETLRGGSVGASRTGAILLAAASDTTQTAAATGSFAVTAP